MPALGLRGLALDLRVYAITPDWGSVGEIAAAAERVLRRGATCLQLRSKHLSTRDQLELGRRLRRLTRDAGSALIVNDRPDVAIAIEADGVHVGQDDLPVPLVRRMLGYRGIIGVSVETVDEARRAEEEGATYLGTGPLFATTSKHDAGDPYGPGIVTTISKATRLPVVAIGGINVDNASQAIAAGAQGVAVISALFGPGVPDTAATELRQRVDEALAQQQRAVTPPAQVGFSLHFVVDRHRIGEDWSRIARVLSQPGATGIIDWFHARFPQSRTGEFISFARGLKDLALGHRAGIIVNDRCDIAAAIAAGGVQLPEQGLSVDEARTVLGRRGLIGRSVHDEQGAQRAVADGADYLLLGHIFPTRSKPHQEPVGPDTLARVVEFSPVPVIAIGGISVDNVDTVLSTGCSGIAVVDAIAAAADPLRAAITLREKIETAGYTPVLAFPPARPAINVS